MQLGNEATRPLTREVYVYNHHSKNTRTVNTSDSVLTGILRSYFDFDSGSTMFGSTASASNSSSGMFGRPPVFGQWNRTDDAFAPKPLGSETVFGSPTLTGMSNYGGISTTSSPLSSTTTFGARSYAGFGSPMPASGFSSVHSLGSSSSTSVQGLSSSGNFGFPPQKEDSFASKTSDSTNVFASQIGMPNSHGSLTWASFNQTSSPLSPTFGDPAAYGSRNSTSGGQSTFNFKMLPYGEDKTGSRISDYRRTAEAGFSAEKLVSISAMPVYKDKSHEEIRWEDYNSTRKGGFGLSSSAVKSTSSSLSPFSSPSITNNLSTISWGNTSISTTPVKPNPFGKTFHSVAKESTTWKFPGPTSTSFTPQPLHVSSFANPFTSLATQTSSSSPTFAPLTWGQPTTPSSLNAFWSTPISVSMLTAPANSDSVSPVSTGLTSTFNQPTTLFTPTVPLTRNNNGAITGIIGQTSGGQLSSSQITTMEQPLSAASPFGTLPPKPQVLFEDSRSTPSIQYGISSMPVKDKPAPVRYPLVTARHLSRRSKLPIRKYDPKLNGPKMPYFSDTSEIPIAVYVPRENPRELVVYPEMWPSRAIMYEEKSSGSIYENDRDNLKENEVLATLVPDIPPKLQLLDYYTKPQTSEMEAKEQADPGFCSHVKDFVIGRYGYGSIKFLGETDVRNLDLESIVQFNSREVIVYMDDTKKPPVGKGLNKPAEITLLNIKCIDKKIGVQYTDGSKIDKYIDLLKKKTLAQGAEFISYDPVGAEWKFRVQHF